MEYVFTLRLMPSTFRLDPDGTQCRACGQNTDHILDAEGTGHQFPCCNRESCIKETKGKIEATLTGIMA
jgi:hypothetical protein